MKLRQALTRYLKHTGLSATTLAEKAGVPKGTLQGWCLGKRPRNMDQVRALAKHMGVSVDALLFDEIQLDVIRVSAADLAGFAVDDDGWHRGTLEVRFRHLPGQAKKS